MSKFKLFRNISKIKGRQLISHVYIRTCTISRERFNGNIYILCCKVWVLFFFLVNASLIVYNKKKTKFKMPCFPCFLGKTLSRDSAKLKHRESNVVLAAEFKLSQNFTMTRGGGMSSSCVACYSINFLLFIFSKKLSFIYTIYNICEENVVSLILNPRKADILGKTVRK